MPVTRARSLSTSEEIIPATDGPEFEDDDFPSTRTSRSRVEKRKRDSSSDGNGERRSEHRSRWTREPIRKKLSKKKKRNVVAGRELRIRGKEKNYAESDSSDEDFEESGTQSDVDEKSEGITMEEKEDTQEDNGDVFSDKLISEDSVAKKIVLKYDPANLDFSSLKSPKTSTLTEFSRRDNTINGSETKEANSVEVPVDDQNAAGVNGNTSNGGSNSTENNGKSENDRIEDEDEDEDEDEEPIRRSLTRRAGSKFPSVGGKGVLGRATRPTTRSSAKAESGSEPPSSPEQRSTHLKSSLRVHLRKGVNTRKSKKKSESESEFEAEDDEDVLDDDDRDVIEEPISPSESESEEEYADRPQRKRARVQARNKSNRPSTRQEESESDLENYMDIDEDELEDLGIERRRQLRAKAAVNYYIPPPPTAIDVPQERRRRNGSSRAFFGDGYGAGMGMGDRFMGIAGLGTTGGVDSSSDSDDDPSGKKKHSGLGNLVPGGSLIGGLAGTPANLGKIKPRNNLADADPLGVDQNIDFTAVGGLDEFIDQLKEMVQLPLLYPEIFQRFGVTPPRGVLFHGPPGTGKTLMARALAASCSTEGRKISFFMRKGADCLSKWVGEAERQLRLLFEEARNSQPSIIFFDEIDGLAPVRSSKQEQIHASIVSTLLALMDGMDGRGQVIVIGATNRPDSVDPALRRPGRFDREFYFPLPDFNARKAIIDIHTKLWDPPLSEDFRREVAVQTKGYGGADLRALCTEAALKAIQRRYPQIYTSKDKLLVDPKTIHVNARDFMLAMKKFVPSSERSTSLGAGPLPSAIQHLLGPKFEEIKALLSDLLPEQTKTTSLEDAMYEDDVEDGFKAEVMLKAFETARTFRPRIIIHGSPGMGQHYLGAAVLHHLEKIHVQSFDLATLMGDSARTPESALVQLFIEVKRHKPSVIYVPNMDSWYRTITEAARETFATLVRGISPSEPILLLSLVECNFAELDPDLKAMFGYSFQNRVELSPPSHELRYRFFQDPTSNLNRPPTEFPNIGKKRKRVLEILEKAPPPPPKVWTKEELQEQEIKDRRLINAIKIKLSPLVDNLLKRYTKLRKPIIDDADISLVLHGDIDPKTLALTEWRRDEAGLFYNIKSSKKFYNLDLGMVKDRLWDGYYLTPQQFIFDIECIVKDAKTLGEKDRHLKGQEMLTNCNIHIDEYFDEQTILDCQRMAEREFERQKARREVKDAKERRKKVNEKVKVVEKETGQGQNPNEDGAQNQALLSQNGPDSVGSMAESISDPTINGDNGSITIGPHATTDTAIVEHNLDINVSVTGGMSSSESNILSPNQLTSPPLISPSSQLFGFNMVQNNTHQDQQVLGILPRQGLEVVGNSALQPFSSTSPHKSVNPPLQPAGYPQPPHSWQPPFQQQETYSQHLLNNDSPSNASYNKERHEARYLGSGTSQSAPVNNSDRLSPDRSGHPDSSNRLSLSSAGNNATDNLISAVENLDRPLPISPPTLTRHPPTLVQNIQRAEHLHNNVTQRTQGYSVEQLEQINAAFMDVIWRFRDQWDRNIVISKTEECILGILGEIEAMKREREEEGQ